MPDCGIGDKKTPCSGPWVGSGGGASDVRTCSELAASCPGGGTSAGSRLIVAAGGGGVGGQGLNGNGGGGYFGGGGGATGMGKCSPAPCGSGGTGQGGAAGSCFVSKVIEYPEVVQAYNTGDVFIEFVPVIEIDRPANGAVYSPGQVIDASWSCGYSYPTELGASNCKGTDASGSRVNMAPGTHKFTVTGNDSSRQPLSVTVIYRVKAGGAGE